MGLRPARMAHQNLIGPHWKPRNARNRGISQPSEGLLDVLLAMLVSKAGWILNPLYFFPYRWEKTIHILPKNLSKKDLQSDGFHLLHLGSLAFLFPSASAFRLGNGQSFRFRVAWTMAERTMFEEKKKDRKRSTWRIIFQWLAFFCCKKPWQFLHFRWLWHQVLIKKNSKLRIWELSTEIFSNFLDNFEILNAEMFQRSSPKSGQ